MMKPIKQRMFKIDVTVANFFPYRASAMSSYRCLLVIVLAVTSSIPV